MFIFTIGFLAKVEKKNPCLSTFSIMKHLNITRISHIDEIIPLLNLRISSKKNICVLSSPAFFYDCQEIQIRQ